ncbi:efp [Trichoplusia ni granulovirus LBIV-12]|uniref:Efp n=1 Tax=Trichoplusia ni granulovirus LBIV-12 TaxID=1916701 RepID=A0A1D8QL33_GVTN|nr:efp [Trichoplusia ni granulovirus LBIV-12]AOW41364.1 efp [Trichoplusia ni granulovirus LBIV-12]
MFVTIFLSFLLFVPSHCVELLDVEQYNDVGGLYFETQSELRYVVSTWSFLVQIDYIKLLQTTIRVKNTTLQLIRRMSKDNDLSNCTSYIDEATFIVNTTVEDLIEQHDELEFILTHKRIVKPLKNSPKRNIFGGAFNFVGRVDKYLFGVMDDKDAELLYKLAIQENSTHYRIKQLTVDSIKLTDIIESLKPELIDVSCIAVERKLQHLRDTLQSVAQAYRKISNAISLSINKQRISTSILTPLQLINTLKGVTESDTHSDWILPPEMSNVHTLMATVNCHAFLTENDDLIFAMVVPRVDKTPYFLHKSMTIPSCDNKHVCKFIVPHSPYIGLSEDKKYVRLYDLSACRTINDFTLCHNSFESNTPNRDSECDAKLLINGRLKDKDYQKCDVRAAKFVPYLFHNVNSLNKWLYMTINPLEIRVQCGTRTFTKQISGTGMLTFRDNCKTNVHHTELVSRYIYNDDDTEYSNYKILHFNLTRYQIPSDYLQLNVGAAIKTLNELTPMRQDLTKLRQQLEENPPDFIIPEHDYRNSDWYKHLSDWWVDLKIFTYMFLALLIGLAFVYIKNCLSPRDSLPVFRSAY